MKTETYALFLAYKDPRTPWYARVFVAGVVAYAVSPIDLIPDFIPILGLLDDLVLLPLALTVAIKLVPEGVLTDCRAKAEKNMQEPLPKKWTAGIIILLAWSGVLILSVIALIKGIQ